MQVELLGVNQKLLFRTRGVVNVLSLRLPSGDAVEVEVPDDIAQKVISAFFKESGNGMEETALPPPPSLPVVVQPQAFEEELPFVFGGEAKPPNGPVALSSEVPPPPPPRRAHRVEKDSMGYPIIRDPSAVDASSVTGGDNQDEDGVGSV